MISTVFLAEGADLDMTLTGIFVKAVTSKVQAIRQHKEMQNVNGWNRSGGVVA